MLDAGCLDTAFDIFDSVDGREEEREREIMGNRERERESGTA